MNVTRWFRLVVSGVMALGGVAQAVDSCAQVYEKATASVETYMRDASSARYVYSQHCRTDGSVSSFNLSLGTSTIFEGLTDTFKLTGGSQNQRLEQFCKTYDAKSFDRETVNSYKRAVVVDSLALFNQCEAILRDNVQVAHTVNGPNVTVQVDFDPTKARVTLTSLLFDPKLLQCTASGLRQSGRVEKLSSPSPAVQAQRSFNLSCQRVKVPLQGGSGDYPPAYLTLAINSKPYAISLPGEKLYNFAEASKARQQFEGDQRAIAALQGQVTALQGQVGSLQAQVPQEYQTRLVAMGEGSVAAMADFGGVAGALLRQVEVILITRGAFGYPDENAYRMARLQQHMQQMCGGARPVGLRQIGVSGGNCCGYVLYSYACVRP